MGVSDAGIRKEQVRECGEFSHNPEVVGRCNVIFNPPPFPLAFPTSLPPPLLVVMIPGEAAAKGGALSSLLRRAWATQSQSDPR